MRLKREIKKLQARKQVADIGVIGGSGFFKLLDKVKPLTVRTPFGPPSDKIFLGTYQGKRVAFLGRHGKNHHLPPHKIPYQANIWALKMLGVERIITTCTAGSLQPHIKPGDFVITDHFVDRTKHREDTFFHGPEVAHFSMAEPYCHTLRKLASESCRKLSIPYHGEGTIVVIEGPRFSTKPESRWFSSQGWDVVNMTHYPEVVLARELDICLVNIALVTDWDVGLEGNPEIKPVTMQEILRVFEQNVENVKDLIFEIIPKISKEKKCECGQASQSAYVG